MAIDLANIQFPSPAAVEAAKSRYAVSALPSEYCADEWHRAPCEACARQAAHRSAEIRAMNTDTDIIRLDDLRKKLVGTNDHELRLIYAHVALVGLPPGRWPAGASPEELAPWGELVSRSVALCAEAP